MTERIAEFERVSETAYTACFREFFPDSTDAQACDSYRFISIPKRATGGSAGYDFVTPVGFTLSPGETVTIPTGIRARIDEGWFLMIVPRSGLGFRYRLQLNNTAGIIDRDYYYSENEGHIIVRLINDSRDGRTLSVKAGERLVHGIFIPYGITRSDECESVRNGGFGSTG